MNAFLDKILLSLSLVAAGTSAALFLGDAPARAANNNNPTALTGSDYQPAEPPTMPEVRVQWPEPAPAPEDDLAIYNIFTPPVIFWHKELNQFVFEAVEPPKPVEPFGLELVSIERELYRVQLSQIIGDARLDPDNTIIKLNLPRKRMSVQGSVGESFDEHGFSIEALRVDRITNPDGTFYRQTVVVINDQQLDQTIELNTVEQRFLPDRYFIHMRLVDPNPRDSFTWNNQGEVHQVPSRGTIYTLDAFEVSPPSVRVTKAKPEEDGFEPLSRQLTPAGGQAPRPAPAASPVNESTPDDDALLETLFQ